MTTAAPTDPGLRAALLADVDDPLSPDTRLLVDFLAAAFGPSTAAIIHYGSHAQRSDARPDSAHDFFIIVDRYIEAYRSLAAMVGTGFSPHVAATLARVLPPNVVAVTMPPVTTPAAHALRAKCAVLSTRDLARACSARAKDHFTKGRLFQQVQLAWTRDPASRRAVLDALVHARAETFDWGRPYLPSHFASEVYCRVLLESSYAAEIRPEGGERVAALLHAQRDTLVRLYDALLMHLVSRRILRFDGNVYTDAAPPDRRQKLRVATYLRKSKVRATVRWMKYIWLYEGWLDYIVQKIARRSGMQIQLTARERRWPLVFLWPKAIRYLRARPQRTVK